MSDPLAAMGFSRNHDGSLKRATNIPRTPASTTDTAVLSKDVPLNPSNNTSLRLFLPRSATNKLPLIIYAHGGGFIVSSADAPVFHNFCHALALKISALIVSVDYRLAPEHRLPAAFDDAIETLSWLKTTSDEWITGHADLSNCYLMGSSAGASIALHAGLRLDGDLKPVAVKGLILHQPYFGGVERTPSETNLAVNKTLPLPTNDIMWELSLPEGADRDHEYCNPMKGMMVQSLDTVIKENGWKITVTGCSGDPLVDRQKEFVAALEEKGVAVVAKFVEGEYHGYDILEVSNKGELIITAAKETVRISTS